MTIETRRGGDVDDRTLALHRSLHPDDLETWSFDSAAFDWDTYMVGIHIPSITDPVRRLEAARRRRGERSSTYRELKPLADGEERPNVLVAFDHHRHHRAALHQ